MRSAADFRRILEQRYIDEGRGEGMSHSQYVGKTLEVQTIVLSELMAEIEERSFNHGEPAEASKKA